MTMFAFASFPCLRKQGPTLSVFIGLGLLVCPLLGAQPAWEQGLQQLEKRHATEMISLNQKILAELETQMKKATQAADLPKANELAAKKKELIAENEQLKKAGSPGAPSSEDVLARRVIKEGEGKLWKMENTQNVKAVILEPGGVRAATLNGEAYGGLITNSQMLPGLFYGLRNDGNGQARMALT